MNSKSGFRINFTAEEQEYIIASAMKNHGLKRADAEKLLERDLPTKRNPLLDAQWVHNLHYLCEELRGGKAESIDQLETVFWIRLYGVLTDLRNRYRKSGELSRDSREQGYQEDSFTAACGELFEACDELHRSLSDDELIFVTFIRHIHAHVYQEGFEYTVERGNPDQKQPAAVRTRQMVPTVRRHVDVDEAHQILDKILAKYDFDETRTAVNFAHKVGPYVERLETAMKALEREREIDRAASAARQMAAVEASD